MACPDSEPFRETEHEFEVCRAADGGNEGAELFKTLPFTVESGVSRAPAFLERTGSVFFSSPGSDYLSFFVDVVQIPVDSICFWIGTEGLSNISQDVVVLIVVIGIEESDYLSRGHTDTFVHGIVDTLIRF